MGGISAIIVAAGAYWAWPTVSRHLVTPRLVGPLCGLAILLSLKFAVGRLPAWLGIRHLFTYPPLWVSAVIGFVALGMLYTLLPETVPALWARAPDPSLLSSWAVEAGRVSWWAVVVVALLLAAIGWSYVALDPGTTPPEPATADERDAALQRWVCTDDEISTPAMDLFGHSRVARRIADRLANSFLGDGEAPTMVLIGPLGSGKTSIRNLVQYELNNDTAARMAVELVPISVWPFDSPEAAVRGILGTLTNHLSNHVGASSITGLPTEYVETIERFAGGRLPLREVRSPEEVLRRYSQIATALGLHVVLVVEDLERFARVAETDAEARLQPIRSLLYLLDRANGISVVLATTSLSTRFDVDKLARFIEYVPRVELEDAVQLLVRFREIWLKQLEGFIDANPRRKSSSLMGTSAADATTMRALGHLDSAQQLAALVPTPRALKQAIRLAQDIWESLVGEIDLDDVIVLCVLRVAEPEFYARLSDHIEIARQGPGRLARLAGVKEPENPIKKALDLVASDRRGALEAILDFLFPLWKQAQSQSFIYQRPHDRAQGVAVLSHADYWTRFNSQPELRTDERDQVILEAIVLWKERRSGPILAILSRDPGPRINAIESFAHLMEPADRLDLFDALIKQRASETAEDWPKLDHGPQPPGVVPMWRVFFLNDFDPGALKKVLIAGVGLGLRTNLELAQTLLQFFATRSEKIRLRRLTDDDLGEILLSRVEGLLRLAESPSEVLVRALIGASRPVILQLCWTLDRLRDRDQTGQPFEGWPAFADFLLRAARDYPAEVVPHLMPFFIGLGPPDLGKLRQAYRVDAHEADRLFGVGRLEALLADVRSQIDKEDALTLHQVGLALAAFRDEVREGEKEE